MICMVGTTHDEPACERKTHWIGWQSAWQLEVRWIINNKVTTLGCPRASPQADWYLNLSSFSQSSTKCGLPSLLIQKTGLRDNLGKVRSEKDRMKGLEYFTFTKGYVCHSKVLDKIHFWDCYIQTLKQLCSCVPNGLCELCQFGHEIPA